MRGFMVTRRAPTALASNWHKPAHIRSAILLPPLHCSIAATPQLSTSPIYSRGIGVDPRYQCGAYRVMTEREQIERTRAAARAIGNPNRTALASGESTLHCVFKRARSVADRDTDGSARRARMPPLDIRQRLDFVALDTRTGPDSLYSPDSW